LETIHKREQELISYLRIIVNNTMQQQELTDLTAEEIPDSVFDHRLASLDSHEDYVDLDSMQSVTTDWAYNAVQRGKTMINKIELVEFLGIFKATLAFFRLKIDGLPRYLFAYICSMLLPTLPFGVQSTVFRRILLLSSPVFPALSAPSSRLQALQFPM